MLCVYKYHDAIGNTAQTMPDVQAQFLVEWGEETFITVNSFNDLYNSYR